MKICSIALPARRFDIRPIVAVLCVTVAMLCITSQAGAQTLSGELNLSDPSLQIINASAVETVASGSTSLQQVGHIQSACRSCGVRRCNGSCGPHGFGSLTGSNVCAPCDPIWYGMVEGLYMERSGEERFSLSPNYALQGFQHEFGGRITVGAVPDCVHGWEATYTGEWEWDMSGATSGAAGSIATFLRAGLPLVSGDLSAFNTNVTSSSQTYTADYWNVELNKTLTGWEVAKLLLGFRYIDYDEDLTYNSVSTTETGSFASVVDNRMFGLQVGMDLLYPISRSGYTDFRFRLGGFINFFDTDIRLNNNGTNLISNFSEDEEFAGILEIGSGVRYQLGRYLTVRGGVELWYMAGVATANHQFVSLVTPSTGFNGRANDEVLVTGLTFGAEIRL